MIGIQFALSQLQKTFLLQARTQERPRLLPSRFAFGSTELVKVEGSLSRCRSQTEAAPIETQFRGVVPKAFVFLSGSWRKKEVPIGSWQFPFAIHRLWRCKF